MRFWMKQMKGITPWVGWRVKSPKPRNFRVFLQNFRGAELPGNFLELPHPRTSVETRGNSARRRKCKNFGRFQNSEDLMNCNTRVEFLRL